MRPLAYLKMPVLPTSRPATWPDARLNRDRLHTPVPDSWTAGQCLQGQHVGGRILLKAGSVGLDGVHHGVDASQCGNLGGHADSQFRIQDYRVGIQLGGDHAHLGGSTRDDD